MQNDTEKALEIFDEILEIEPENIDAINGKGSSLMKLNRLDEADEYFNQSISIHENTSSLLNKGNICKQQKDFDNALSYYDKTLKINSNLKNIIKILKSEITEDSETNFIEINNLLQKGIELKNKNKMWDSLDMFIKAIETDSTCMDAATEQIDEIKSTFEREFIYDDCEFDIDNKIDRL